MSAQSKTPVSLLQEVCAKRALTPIYELISNQGLTHEPSYLYKCSAGPQWTAQSKGSSKKKAKHYVALLILVQMVIKVGQNEVNKQLLEEVKASASGLLGRDDAFKVISAEYLFSETCSDNIFDTLELGSAMECPLNEEEVGNPIGTLQELCQKNMWPQASYEFAIYHGNHDSQCTLTLWRWTMTAEGKSRKLAKRKAAVKMLEKLNNENLTIPRDMLDMLEEGNLKLHDENGPEIEHSKESNIVTEIQRAYSRNLRGIYNNKGECIKTDLINSSKSFSDKLNEFCQTKNFIPLYTYISKTKSGVIYCLLQLNTNPIHVVRGKGDTLEDSRENASLECLNLLSNMINAKPLKYSDS